MFVMRSAAAIAGFFCYWVGIGSATGWGSRQPALKEAKSPGAATGSPSVVLKGGLRVANRGQLSEVIASISHGPINTLDGRDRLNRLIHDIGSSDISLFSQLYGSLCRTQTADVVTLLSEGIVESLASAAKADGTSLVGLAVATGIPQLSTSEDFVQRLADRLIRQRPTGKSPCEAAAALVAEFESCGVSRSVSEGICSAALLADPSATGIGSLRAAGVFTEDDVNRAVGNHLAEIAAADPALAAGLLKSGAAKALRSESMASIILQFASNGRWQLIKDLPQAQLSEYVDEAQDRLAFSAGDFATMSLTGSEPGFLGDQWGEKLRFAAMFSELNRDRTEALNRLASLPASAFAANSAFLFRALADSNDSAVAKLVLEKIGAGSQDDNWVKRTACRILAADAIASGSVTNLLADHQDPGVRRELYVGLAEFDPQHAVGVLNQAVEAEGLNPSVIQGYRELAKSDCRSAIDFLSRTPDPMRGRAMLEVVLSGLSAGSLDGQQAVDALNRVAGSMVDQSPSATELELLGAVAHKLNRYYPRVGTAEILTKWGNQTGQDLNGPLESTANNRQQ